MQTLSNLVTKEKYAGYLFCIPILLIILLLILFPFLLALYMSLTNKMVGYPATFIGLKNYIDLYHSLQFRKVLANTLVYTFFSCAVKLILGMIMALILNEAVKARQFLRGFLLIPWITPDVVNAVTWRWIFELQRGFANNFLLDTGIVGQPFHWFSSELAMACVITANVWRGFPFFGVALLAAMQTVPRTLYEAAEMDGASSVRKFIHITIPHIMTVILICSLLSIIWTINDFNIVYLMTKGGPGSATHIVATYSYELGIESLRYGTAVAASFYTIPFLILLIYLIHRHVLRER